jgi:RNA polymerase sigma-70 factor (ECF subfamily)
MRVYTRGVGRDELLRELYGPVRKHIYFLLGSSGLADDAVQETMIAIHRGLDGFRGEANPRTWALTIATRTALRMRKREARYVATDEVDAAVFDVDTSAAAELVLLRRALATLDPKKRDAFVLMSIFELTAEEAGKALQTFANTAASRNRHARAELEAYLTRGRDAAGV